ncbi:glutamate-1-semialdehyde 2,1-aminomutase [bacterium]|nr:glutamate-1-semialdehyde 2,1-aminomutase [bacterium]
MNSKELFERALKVAPGGVHSPVRAFKSVGGTPVFFKSAQGAYLQSVEDKKYIDFCMSFGPLLLGHRDPEVQEEVLRMVNTAWTFGACEPYSLELAEWMTSSIPWLEKVRFVSSGTEAVMSTLRVARAVTGRSKILKFEGCYHGHTDALLVKAGSGLAGLSASDSAGVTENIAQDTLVVPLDDEKKLEEVFNQFHLQIAAAIIEPLPANFGLIIQKQSFLKKLAELCEKSCTMLIFDEVISGFRVAHGGMAELTGIRPDLVCYGKIIGGGFPVGCYGGKKEFMNLVAPSGPVYQAGTLSGNPIGMRAGLVTLKKAQRENVWGVLKDKTTSFKKSLLDLFAKNSLDFKIAQYPSLFWIHSSQNENPANLTQIPQTHGENFKKFFHACLEEGIYLAPSGFEVSFLSLAHSDSVLNESLEKFSKAIQKYKGQL